VNHDEQILLIRRPIPVEAG